MNSQEILRTKAVEQGWTTETCLQLICDFINSLHTKLNNINMNLTPDNLEEIFTYYLNARAFQETDEYKEYVKNMFGDNV